MGEMNIDVKEMLLCLPPYHRLMVTPAGTALESVRKVIQNEAEIGALLNDLDLSKNWLIAYHQPGQPLTITIGTVGFSPFAEDSVNPKAE